MRFKEKTVIVTGGAGGIGLAIASRFASEGSNVVLADISKEQLQQASMALTTYHDKYLLSECDVSNEEQVKATVDETIKKFGTLDVMVNNAGLMIFKKLEEQETA